MKKKMLLSENERAGIVGISLLLMELIFIIGNVLGIVSLFHNSTLTKNPFVIFLFCLGNYILSATLLFMLWGFWLCISDNGDGTNSKRGSRMLKNGWIASFFIGTFILLSDVIFLNIPFGIHLLFSDCFLLILAMQIYKTWSAMPEEDTKARFIDFLKNILPIQFQEEWLGDLQEKHNYSINEAIKNGDPISKVYRETLLRGLGLIWSYLWLKAHKFVSRWMTRAK